MNAKPPLPRATDGPTRNFQTLTVAQAPSSGCGRVKDPSRDRRLKCNRDLPAPERATPQRFGFGRVTRAEDKRLKSNRTKSGLGSKASSPKADAISAPSPEASSKVEIEDATPSISHHPQDGQTVSVPMVWTVGEA